MAVVDSGATTCTINNTNSVCDMQPSMSVFSGFDASGEQVKGDADGKLHLYAYDPGDASAAGCGVTIPVTVLRRGRHNLFSVKTIVEDLGWDLILKPSYKGDSGFYKTVDGEQRRTPVTYDADARLYKLHYGLGNSREEAKRAAARGPRNR